MAEPGKISAVSRAAYLVKACGCGKVGTEACKAAQQETGYTLSLKAKEPPPATTNAQRFADTGARYQP